jgi:hypothetical protein
VFPLKFILKFKNVEVLNNRMFNTRLDPNGEPKQDETNGNEHHVLENGGELTNIILVYGARSRNFSISHSWEFS